MRKVFLRLRKYFLLIRICYMEHLLTTEEAAERLGVTAARVRQLILSGQLPARKFAKVNMIDARDLELVKDRPKAGRPRKGQAEKALKRQTKKRGKK
jgi:excisionase family DNA binding protein